MSEPTTGEPNARLRKMLDEGEQRAALLRAQVEELTAERDLLADEHGELAAALGRERAETERLRLLVGQAIDAGARNDSDEIRRVQREAGLS